MKLKKYDSYHRKQIYGAMINFNYTKNPEKKAEWGRKLVALKKSAKQLKK